MDNTQNPYATPQSASFELDHVYGPVIPASQGARLLNMLIDSVLVQIVSAVAGLAFGIVYAMSRANSTETVSSDDEALLELVGFVLGMLVVVFYYVFTEFLFQRSPAKLITGTRVVSHDGRRPSFGQVVGRTLARFIPFEAFSFLGDKGPVGWHDSLSGTRVIKTRSVRSR